MPTRASSPPGPRSWASRPEATSSRRSRSRTLTESRAAAPPGRFVHLVDKLFPLVWVALYALLPVSGSSERFQRTSFDQARDLEALRSVLENGSAAAIADNLIGPAYIATAALIHWVSGLSPGDALTALTRLSYVLAVAGCLVLVRALVRRLASESPAVSLPAQLSFVVLVFVAGTWHWSDIAVESLLRGVSRRRLLSSCDFSRHVRRWQSLRSRASCLSLLALTRSFEFDRGSSQDGAWRSVSSRCCGFADRRCGGLPGFAIGTAAFLATTAAVYAVTGKRNAFLQYRSDRGDDYGVLRPEEIASDSRRSTSLSFP